MADISALGELRPVAQLDLENYIDNRNLGNSKAGRYTVQGLRSFPFGVLAKLRKGISLHRSNPTIIWSHE